MMADSLSLGDPPPTPPPRFYRRRWPPGASAFATEERNEQMADEGEDSDKNHGRPAPTGGGKRETFDDGED